MTTATTYRAILTTITAKHAVLDQLVQAQKSVIGDADMAQMLGYSITKLRSTVDLCNQRLLVLADQELAAAKAATAAAAAKLAPVVSPAHAVSQVVETTVASTPSGDVIATIERQLMQLPLSQTIDAAKKLGLVVKHTDTGFIKAVATAMANGPAPVESVPADSTTAMEGSKPQVPATKQTTVSVKPKCDQLIADGTPCTKDAKDGTTMCGTHINKAARDATNGVQKLPYDVAAVGMGNVVTAKPAAGTPITAQLIDGLDRGQLGKLVYQMATELVGIDELRTIAKLLAGV